MEKARKGNQDKTHPARMKDPGREDERVSLLFVVLIKYHKLLAGEKGLFA